MEAGRRNIVRICAEGQRQGSARPSSPEPGRKARSFLSIRPSQILRSATQMSLSSTARCAQLLLLLPLLLLLTFSTASGAASPRTSGWPADLEQSVRDLRADIEARLLADGRRLEGLEKRLRQPTVANGNHGEASPPEDARLVIRNRAGSHIFQLHRGRAVAAQLGANRVYSVMRDGLFVSEVCTCGRRACARRYKPAFYCLLASGCLLAIVAVATVGATLVQRRREAVAAADAAATEAVKPLLLGGGLSVQCDPVVCAGRCVTNIEKASI